MNALRAWAAEHHDVDTSPIEIVELLHRITTNLGEAVEPIYDGAPLSGPELAMLMELRHFRAPVMARRLAELVGISPAGVSKALTRLGKRGLIERSASTTDRRASLVSVTQSGIAAIDNLMPRRLRIEAELLTDLGADRAKVLEALHLLAQSVERGAQRLSISASAPATATWLEDRQ
jgi:DNA-binding MarR family transcriptional regulator